jgi:hypothetical protein
MIVAESVAGLSTGRVGPVGVETMSRFGSAAGLVPFVLVIACAPAPEDKKSIPGDFEIVAEYYPGYSDWKPWKTTIAADGKVVQEPWKSKKNESRLTEKDLHDLIRKVKEANFFALKERYEVNATDCATLLLTVTRDKTTHKVAVYGDEFLRNNKEVGRFLRVWSELLRKVPSPNPKQKAELYKT